MSPRSNPPAGAAGRDVRSVFRHRASYGGARERPRRTKPAPCLAPRTSAGSRRKLARRRRRVLDRAPGSHPVDREPDDRPLLQAMRPVLLVLLAEGRDRRRMLLHLARLGLEDLAAAVEAQPREL